MTTPARRLAVAVLLAPATFGLGCEKKEAPPSPRVAEAPKPATVEDAATQTPTPATAPSPAARAEATRPGAARPRPTATPPAASTAAAPALSPSPAPPVDKPPSAPAPLPTRARPKGTITLPAKLGAVTFDHVRHADKMKVACATCHHPSRPEKPPAAQQQACRECHTSPAAAPMKTGVPAAFHDPKAARGVCIDCHREAAARGEPAPVKCLDCHRKK